MKKQDVIRERLQSERPAVKMMLRESIEAFFEKPSQVSFSEVCNALITAVVYGLTCYVPMELSEGEFVYYLEKNAKNEYGYVICDSSEELSKCGNGAGGVMKIKNLLERALNDEDPRINGVIINPYHYPRKYLLQLTNKNVDYILASAEELINSQDPETQIVLREGLSE